jgi:hypothetical protein
MDEHIGEAAPSMVGVPLAGTLGRGEGGSCGLSVKWIDLCNHSQTHN